MIHASQPDSRAEQYRDYLKLLAGNQLDSFLAGRVDASDVVQATLMDALVCREQFRGTTEKEYLAWLRRILHNRLVDQYRHHRREKRDASKTQSLEGSIGESFRRVDALALSGDTPSQLAVHNEQLKRLPAALQQLSEGQRQAIVLHHLQGLKLAETSQRMGKSEVAVCGLLSRGLRRLHELMEE